MVGVGERDIQPSSKHMLSYTKYRRGSKAMISSKFLKEISHFHCLLKVVILDYTEKENRITKGKIKPNTKGRGKEQID